MMNLQEVFDQLSSSELMQLSVGGQPAGEINEDNAFLVVRHINLALTMLYARFKLKQGSLLLEPVPDQTIYAITSDYAVHKRASRQLVRYLIDDPAAPFADDIQKIEQVLTDGGVELPLNDESNRYSAFTPTSTTLRLPLDVVNQVQDLPDDLKTEHLELVYRASHPKVVLPVGLYDPTRVKLQLPATHLAPLLYFVASRIHMPATLATTQATGDPYMARYEQACLALENQGFQVDNSAAVDKLRSRGFV